MAFGAEHIGDAARGRQLDTVALVIIHRQREHAIPLLARAGGGDHRVEPAGDEHDGQRIHTPVLAGNPYHPVQIRPMAHATAAASAGMGNLVAQNAQSTWISPFSSAISRRSSGVNLASTLAI
ncbi:hypothetical protein WR25_18030 [Diploscapter pachys]|uniref:Uncharacterized protein n=1 Tax=Diploscapter pachys TaxID=2018661 RepID=A0A2A2M461_9BILA|nr:hypothetical protein WR25_18030 [Diploscapter pachys]